jgi:hypothetical protein
MGAARLHRVVERRRRKAPEVMKTEELHMRTRRVWDAKMVSYAPGTHYLRGFDARF